MNIFWKKLEPELTRNRISELSGMSFAFPALTVP